MNTATPTISVVVPVYNGESTIAKCVESLLNQAYPRDKYDVIVVENGSTDHTTEIASRYPITLLHNTVRGPSAARQLGLNHSQANIVVFTDADCYADVNWLSEMVTPYQDAHVGGVGGKVMGYKHADRNIVEQFCDDNLLLTNFSSGEVEYMPRLNTCNASYRRELAMQIGGFDTRLVTADDTDISWRLQLKTGARLAYAPNAIVYHHHRSTQAGLSKQYRQYGFAEILLDTMYSGFPNYPRTRRWQIGRMMRQVRALPQYAISYVVRQARLMAGHATLYQAETPKLCMLTETSNLRGKLDGLKATRCMRDASGALGIDAKQLIDRYFQSKKE